MGRIFLVVPWAAVVVTYLNGAMGGRSSCPHVAY